MDELLEMAQELDGMDRGVTSWEAGFLESVLTRLRNRKHLTSKQEEKLRELYERYFEGEGPAPSSGSTEDAVDDNEYM